MYVRISKGRFDPAKLEDVMKMLNASEESLAPALKKMPGFLFYKTGVDRPDTSKIVVSYWDSREHADELGSLPEMAALSVPFQANGVVFEPITTYEILWEI